MTAQSAGCHIGWIRLVALPPYPYNLELTGGFQQHYFKALAYRVEPQSPKGFLSIDGEAYPLAPYELEVHKGLGAFLSMYGWFQFDFDLPSNKTAKK